MGDTKSAISTLNKKATLTMSSNTRFETEQKQEIPEGAKIIEKSIRTESEKIENGYLVTKHYSGRYIPKGSTETYGNYFSYDKKWYSEEEPITVTVNDKALADAFDED